MSKLNRIGNKLGLAGAVGILLAVASLKLEVDKFLDSVRVA